MIHENELIQITFNTHEDALFKNDQIGITESGFEYGS